MPQGEEVLRELHWAAESWRGLPGDEFPRGGTFIALASDKPGLSGRQRVARSCGIGSPIMRSPPSVERTSSVFGATRSLVLLVVALSAALSACEMKKAEQVAPPAPPTVVVAKVEQRDVIPYDIFTGTLAANQYVKILPRVSGFVASIPFKPGAFIKAGTVLFKLDDRPFKAALDQANADLAVKEANLQNATDERDRQERLAKQDATNEKDLLNARNNFRAATAAVAAGKAAVEAAQVNFDYCTISSPIDGKVDTNAVEVGDLVSPGSTKPLTSVAEIDPIKVDFSLTESMTVELLKTRGVDKNKTPAHTCEGFPGQRQRLPIRRGPGLCVQHAGPVHGHDPGTGDGQQCRPEAVPRAVRAGEALAGGAAQGAVDQRRIGQPDIGGDYVWVIKSDNTAEKRYVKLGTLVEQWRVVQSGLAADETYVLQGIQRVRDRAKVTPKAPTTAVAAVAATQP